MTLLAIHSIACVMLLVRVSSLDDLGSLFFVGMVALLMVAPIAALLLRKSMGYLSLVAAIALSLSGFYLYWRSFFGPDVDAQAGLVLIFLPIYQLLAAALVIALGWLIEITKNKAS